MADLFVFIKRKSYLLQCIFFLFISWVCGCSGEIDSSPGFDDSGAITFKIEWPDIDTENDFVRTDSFADTSCMDNTIETVIFAIYGEDGSLLIDMEDATFDCSAGEGVVEKVPAGKGIKLLILAQSSDSEGISVRGEHPHDITVEKGKTTNIGNIETYSFRPELSNPPHLDYLIHDALTFEWDEVDGASGYTITFTQTNRPGNETKEYVSTENSFSPVFSEDVFFSAGVSYQWYVTAIDAYENTGINSKIRQFFLMY